MLRCVEQEASKGMFAFSVIASSQDAMPIIEDGVVKQPLVQPESRISGTFLGQD